MIHREMKCPNLHNMLHFGYATSFMFAAAVFLLGLCTVENFRSSRMFIEFYANSSAMWTFLRVLPGRRMFTIIFMQITQTDIANHAFVLVCALWDGEERMRKPSKVNFNFRFAICNSKDLNECMTRKLMALHKSESVFLIDSQWAVFMFINSAFRESLAIFHQEGLRQTVN